MSGRLHRRVASGAALLALAAGALGAQGVDRPTPTGVAVGIDVVHYDLAVSLPDSGRIISGVSTLLVQARREARTLSVDILLPVDSVTVDGARSSFAARAGGVLVPLGAEADSARVAVYYHGAPGDGLIISRDPEGRWQAFGDNWPNRARHWLAVVDRPGDKATVSWTIDAPTELTVVANGARTDSSRSAARPWRTIWRWEERHPIATYLMVLAAAPLRAEPLASTKCLARQEEGCLEQTLYLAKDAPPGIPAAFREAEGIVAFYSSLVGPFPYEKLAHLQSTTRFGGMENATAIFYADALFRNGTIGSSIVAHETAHQWFGDAVTESEWPHLWLSEGFATYFAELWAERSRGRDTLVAHMRAIRGGLLGDNMVVAQRPVIDTAATDLMSLLNSNSYEKGGYVLHMARRLLGDSVFFRGLRGYYAGHRDGNATSDDLRRALEGASGRDLGWFFDQWLRRPGYPELDTRWSYDPREQRVYLQIAQRRRFGNFRLPLVVELVRKNGSILRATVEVPAQQDSRIVVPIDLDAPPARVILDPDADLLAAISPPRKTR
jgi:aminopeptidase N